jgi:hypothetical protein
MNKKELWTRIKNYQFDNLVPHSIWDSIATLLGPGNASTRAFANKIMKKHRLPHAFVYRAIEEYKKFIYLGIVSDFYVTPSKYIDLIWHEHILFSKGYREFCNNVIRYQFDHQPELMATGEQTELFTAQYVETLELYKTEFGREPPENIWGVPKFAKEKIGTANKTSSKKKRNDSGSGDFVSGDAPLCSHYNEGVLESEFSGFEGGDFGGAGTGGDFGDSSGDSGGDGGGCSGGCGGGD